MHTNCPRKLIDVKKSPHRSFRHVANKSRTVSFSNKIIQLKACIARNRRTNEHHCEFEVDENSHRI